MSTLKIKMLNGEIGTVEFGMVKRVPGDPMGLVYVRGFGTRDVYVPLNMGSQVTAGFEMAEISRRLLQPRLTQGQELFFVPVGPRSNGVLAWGIADFYRKADETIKARPSFRLTQMAFYKGEMASNPTKVLGEGTLVKLTSILGDLNKLPARAMDLSFTYHWEKLGGDGVLRSCRNPVATLQKKVNGEAKAGVDNPASQVVGDSKLVGLPKLYRLIHGEFSYDNREVQMA